MEKENYFFGEIEGDSRRDSVFALVIYDIMGIRAYRFTSRSEVIKWGKDLSTDMEEVVLI